MVDSDRTASQILSIMNRSKMGGEVTFLPLNKLQPPNPHYPTSKVGREGEGKGRERMGREEVWDTSGSGS